MEDSLKDLEAQLCALLGMEPIEDELPASDEPLVKEAWARRHIDEHLAYAIKTEDYERAEILHWYKNYLNGQL